MVRRLLAVALVAFAAASARAGLFGRSKLVSRWTAKPVPVNGDESGWNDADAFEEDGLSVLAMNDASDLYLLITGHTRESRDQLSGESHQDLSLSFDAPDGKTRRWGARLPFSRRAPVTSALREPAGLDPEPEQVRYQGAAISTDTLPDDVVDRLVAVGRRPIWKFKIPLKRLEPNPDGAVAVDFVVAAPPGGAKRRAVQRTPTESPPADGGSDSAAARNRGGGKHGDAASHPEDLVWDASSYSLTLRLARDPSLPR